MYYTLAEIRHHKQVRTVANLTIEGHTVKQIIAQNGAFYYLESIKKEYEGKYYYLGQDLQGKELNLNVKEHLLSEYKWMVYDAAFEFGYKQAKGAIGTGWMKYHAGDFFNDTGKQFHEIKRKYRTAFIEYAEGWVTETHQFEYEFDKWLSKRLTPAKQWLDPIEFRTELISGFGSGYNRAMIEIERESGTDI